MLLVIVSANTFPQKPQTNNTKQQCNCTCFLENKKNLTHHKDTMILDHSFLYSGGYFNKSLFYFLRVSISNIAS